MHILFICNEYPPAPYSGIGIFTQTLAIGLLEHNIQVAVIGYDPTISTTQTKLEDGVLVRRLPLPQSSIAIKFGRYSISYDLILQKIRLSNQLETFIEEFKPDLIESYDWAGPLWRKPRLPLIVRLHGSNSAHQLYERKRQSALVRYFENKNIRAADYIISVSKHMLDLSAKAFRINHINSSVIYNPVNTTVFRRINNIEKRADKLLYIGRIDKRKGLTELFNCLNLLFGLHPTCTLELVGPPNINYQATLLSSLKSKHLNRVIFSGKIDHHKLPIIINEASIVIMPSKAEAFGLTIAESMACGTPVIVNNKASGPEIVENNISGIVLDFDSPSECSIAINNLLLNPSELSRIGINGMERAKKVFSKENVVQQNIAIYKTITNDI